MALCDAPSPREGKSWADDGSIVFAATKPKGSLWRLPGSGGAPEAGHGTDESRGEWTNRDPRRCSLGRACGLVHDLY